MEVIVNEAPVGVAQRVAPAYPTIKESWAALGWFLLIMILVSIPVFIGFNSILHRKSITLSAIATVLGELATIGALVWFNRQRLPRIHMLGQVPGWLYLALPVMVVAQIVLRSLVQYLHLPNWMEEAFRMLNDKPVLAVLVVCISAPVLEEILFRGVLLTGLLRNYRPWVAIGQSALLFGLFHLNPVQIVSAGIMGLLLGWLYHRTHSLLLCIILHALNNGLAVWANLSAPLRGGADFSTVVSSPWLYGSIVLISATVLAVLLRQVHQATTLPLEAATVGIPETPEAVYPTTSS